jgi:hypothetical protein
MLYDRMETSNGSSVLPDIIKGPWPNSATPELHEALRGDDRDNF